MGGKLITGDHNETITAGIPPETSTPMPGCLWYIYFRELGWPGRPEDYRPDIPGELRIDPATSLQRCPERRRVHA